MKSLSAGLNWRTWVLNCTIGEMLGIGLASSLIFITTGIFGVRMTMGNQYLVLAIMIAAGTIEGSILGFFQWRALKMRYPNLTASSWIGSTVAGATFCWLLGSLPSTLVTAAQPESIAMGTPPLAVIATFIFFSGLILGSILGFAQWLALKNHANHAIRWIGANALGWTMALFWIYAAASLPSEQTPIVTVLLIGIASGILSGITFGAITWSFLKNLTPQSLNAVQKYAA